MNHTRPKNLNLFTIRFPLPAIVSILHRISGVILFFLVPFMLWGLDFSLTSDGFETLKELADDFLIKLILLALLAPFCYHIVAGIRHLLMDIHIGSSLKVGRQLAAGTFVATFILIILIGIWLW